MKISLKTICSNCKGTGKITTKEIKYDNTGT